MSMTGLFKSFFNNDDKKEKRTLEHPRDLNKEDIIKFDFMPQADLSNQQFQVTDVNTYDFEDRKLTEFTLKGDTPSAVYMTVDESGDEAFLSFSRKINRNVVEALFDMDEFSSIFDTDEATTLNCTSDQALLSKWNLENWTTEQYIQEVNAEGGYYHKGDYRTTAIPANEDDGDDFEHYLLIGNKREFVVEAEVYDGGETDIIITIRRPLTDIEEMYPA